MVWHSSVADVKVDYISCSCRTSRLCRLGRCLTLAVKKPGKWNRRLADTSHHAVRNAVRIYSLKGWCGACCDRGTRVPSYSLV